MGLVKVGMMSESVKQWTPNQVRFQEWLALPDLERMPLNQRALAKELELNEATLSRWRRLPGFETEVQRLIRENIGDALADVMGAFKAEAKKGSFPHQKMYFEMIGFYTQKQEITGANGAALTIKVIYADDTNEVEAEGD